MGIIFWSTSKMRSAGAGVFFTFLVGGSQQLPQYSDYGEEYFPGFYSSPGIDPRVQYPLPAGFERPPAFVRDNFGRGRSDLEIDFRQVANEGDIIAQTRNLANNVKATLQQLADNPKSATLVNRIINDKDNICLRSLQDGLAGIEAATKLVEAAGDDIKALLAKVKAFETLSEPAIVVREVANILRILGPLVNNIAPESPVICQASPDQAFGSLRSLAVLLDELYLNPPLPLSPAQRRQLKDSSNTISAVTTLITQLGDNFSKFQEICTPDKEYNFEAISAIGDLMENLADMFGSLGGVQTSQNIRKGKPFVEKLVGELNKISDDLGVGDLSCETPGDFTIAANTLEDVATLIDDIGLKSLQEQLGVDLSFVVGNNP